jgi:multiple sugar transport system ATP-binding protein
VEMRAAVSRLQQRLETTTVYVTHDQTEAMTLGDRVAVMRAGILQQVDNPRELYDHPRNIFVAGFIGSPAMNFFTGAIQNDSIQTPMGPIPLHDELRRRLESHGTGSRDVIVGIRPEDFEDSKYAPEGHRGYEFDASIELTESMGSEIYAHFDFEQTEELESEELRELQEDAGTTDVPGSASGHAVARVDAASGVKAGEKARLWLDTDKIHLFNLSDGLSLTRPTDGNGAATG